MDVIERDISFFLNFACCLHVKNSLSQCNLVLFLFFCMHKHYHDTPPELLSFPHSAYSALFFPTSPTPTPFFLAMTRFKGKTPDFLQSFVGFRSILRLAFSFFFSPPFSNGWVFFILLYMYICVPWKQLRCYCFDFRPTCAYTLLLLYFPFFFDSLSLSARNAFALACFFFLLFAWTAGSSFFFSTLQHWK